MTTKCSVPECDRNTIWKQDFCNAHYEQIRLKGRIVTPTIKQKAPNKSYLNICSVKDCDLNVKSKGLCNRHYLQSRLTGITDKPPKKPKGSGASRPDGYRIIRIDHPTSNKRGYAREHRVVLYDKIGPGIHKCSWCPKEINWEDGSLECDHLDFNRSNNHPDNLVPACRSCNGKRTTRW